MNSRRTRAFRKLFASLPPEAKREANTAYQLWKRDPFYPSLQFKELEGKPGQWSVRVGLHWRALAKRNGENVTWVWIGPHGQYDKRA